MFPSTGISPKAMDIWNSLVRGTFALTLQRGLGALQVLLGTRNVSHGMHICTAAPCAVCHARKYRDCHGQCSEIQRLLSQPPQCSKREPASWCGCEMLFSQDYGGDGVRSWNKGAILRQVLRALGQPRGMGWDGMGSGIGMGNTCKSMADSCQCMAKTTQYCKVISLQLIKINGKKIIKGGHIHQKDLLCQPQPQSEVWEGTALTLEFLNPVQVLLSAGGKCFAGEGVTSNKAECQPPSLFIHPRGSRRGVLDMTLGEALSVEAQTRLWLLGEFFRALPRQSSWAAFPKHLSSIEFQQLLISTNAVPV